MNGDFGVLNSENLSEISDAAILVLCKYNIYAKLFILINQP